MCQDSRTDAASLIRGFYSSGIIPTIRDMDGMAASLPEQIRTFARGIGVRQVRLVSGVILFSYLVSHFLNHALGNISLDALAAGIYWHMPFWQFPPIALVLLRRQHRPTGLGILALYERRHFRWKATEITQLLLGLSIP